MVCDIPNPARKIKASSRQCHFNALNLRYTEFHPYQIGIFQGNLHGLIEDALHYHAQIALVINTELKRSADHSSSLEHVRVLLLLCEQITSLLLLFLTQCPQALGVHAFIYRRLIRFFRTDKSISGLWVCQRSGLRDRPADPRFLITTVQVKLKQISVLRNDRHLKGF